MKHTKLTLMFIVLLSLCCGAAVKKQEPKRFTVIFTISYNSMTLAEAAKKEASIKNLFGDSCDIDVTVQNVQTLNFWNSSGIGTITWDINDVILTY